MGEPALEPPYTTEEAAKLLNVTTWLVSQMTRDGRLPRIPGIRWIRIPRPAVHALLEGRYIDPDAKPDRQAPSQAPAPRRGNRHPSDGSLAVEAVGGGSSLHRPIGPAQGDVVVRRVTR